MVHAPVPNGSNHVVPPPNHCLYQPPTTFVAVADFVMFFVSSAFSHSEVSRGLARRSHPPPPAHTSKQQKYWGNNYCTSNISSSITFGSAFLNRHIPIPSCCCCIEAAVRLVKLPFFILPFICSHCCAFCGRAFLPIWGCSSCVPGSGSKKFDGI